MTTSRIAVVTGATQGLGLALADGLAHRMDPDDLVLLTGRDPGRVAAAVRGIGGAEAKVEGRVLDVTDTAAVEALAGQLGSVDIVFSNASARMTPQKSPAEQVDLLVETNNLGTIRMLTSFEPILRNGGRLIVVASSFGTLGHLDPRVRAPLGEARTLEDVAAAVAAWRRSVHEGTAEAQGWPHWLNVPSKVAQVAAVRAVAARRRERDLAEGTLIAAACPGLIDTDASRPWFADMSQAQTPAQAAEALLDLALTPEVDFAFHGELVRFGQVLAWETGSAPEARAGVAATRRD
ncbi:MAG TPA: SDR family NAD(P)-dependent oxidoreductase [Actinoplanes sp.]|nr:SDR family NAD(P)-dependent oxidoreductase [Actinoplanes sp.]